VDGAAAIRKVGGSDAATRGLINFVMLGGAIDIYDIYGPAVRLWMGGIGANLLEILNIGRPHPVGDRHRCVDIVLSQRPNACVFVRRRARPGTPGKQAPRPHRDQQEQSNSSHQ
jgi:hypothetical protein